jgi:hypothetical protein
MVWGSPEGWCQARVGGPPTTPFVPKGRACRRRAMSLDEGLLRTHTISLTAKAYRITEPTMPPKTFASRFSTGPTHVKPALSKRHGQLLEMGYAIGHTIGTGGYAKVGLASSLHLCILRRVDEHGNRRRMPPIANHCQSNGLACTSSDRETPRVSALLGPFDHIASHQCPQPCEVQCVGIDGRARVGTSQSQSRPAI